VLAAFTELTARIARSGFLELAEGDWLRLVAKHVYNVDAIEATFAEGTVLLTNAGGGIYDLDENDLIVADPSTGKTYRNTSSFHLGANSSVAVPVAAIEAGSASSSAAGELTQLVTPLLGVTVANATALVGLDAEDDTALRARCAEKLGALSPNGPWDAYSYAARNARRADGTPVPVTRVRTVKDGYGVVSTYLATASGAVSGTVGNLNTDLGAVDDAIQRNAVPLAVTANTYSATPTVIAIAYRLWMYNTSALTEALIKSAIERRLQSFMASQPIGGNVISPNPGKVFLDALRTVIGSAVPQIFHVELDAPLTDVELDVSGVPVLGTVTAGAINQVAPGEAQL
jgi:phage-related baseplate assembly protein